MTAGSHPSRSPEFLSRLHDGELSPAERAHFESHRAHCVECRGAAAEFEAALALYRSSHPHPASPDLAARILRKLQSSGNRRPFFGATFGIDLRWAGAFAAAVIATIVGSAIVAKNEATERRMSRDEPIPVSIARERKAAASEPPLPAAAPAPAPAQNSGLATPPTESRRSRTVPTAEIRSKEEAHGRMAAARPEGVRKDKLAAADSLREKEKAAEADPAGSAPSRLAMKNAAPAPSSEAIAQAPSMDVIAPKAGGRTAERPGGEGAAPGFAEGPPRPVRLVILEADGAGSPPDLLRPRQADIPATLRGRSFLLMVDAAGRVREAVPSASASAAATATATERQEDAASDARKEDVPSLLSLRFTPGDRQRRLLLRIE